MLLGAPKAKPFVPPQGTMRKLKLANFDEQVGSVDSDDNSFTSFQDLLDCYGAVTQDNLRRIAWAIRRTGEIGKIEMAHQLNADYCVMNRLWKIMADQGWVRLEHRGSRKTKAYVATEIGKKMFADTGKFEDINKAA